PDFRNEILDLVTEGNRAAARLRYTGHHRGEILGIPATGILVTYHGAAFFTARDGRLAEAWVLGDVDSLRRQLTCAPARQAKTLPAARGGQDDARAGRPQMSRATPQRSLILTEDMKRVMSEQRLGFVATVCPDGTPSLSPKGTTVVWDDEHLVSA